MELLEISKEEFKKFASSNEFKNFIQTEEMELVSDTRGWKSYYIGVKEKNKVIAASRVLAIKNRFNKIQFYAMRGPLLDYKNYELLKFFTVEIKKFVKKHRGYKFRIDPFVIYKERDINGDLVENGIDNSLIVENLKKIGYKHHGFVRDYDSKQMRWGFVLDIENKDEAEIFKNMKQNHRNIIKKTEKFGIEIKELSYDELPIYKKITQDTSNRRHFNDKPLEYYQAIYNGFGKENKAKFLVAYLNVKKYIENLTTELEAEKNKYQKSYDNNKDSGKTKELGINVSSIEKRLSEANELLKESDMIPLSAALFILYEDEVSYFFSGSYQKYMKFYAQYAIQWHMIRYAIKNKYKIYNFLGINGNFDKNNPEYGVYEFKKGFNGRVVEYIGDFELPVSPYYYIEKFKDKCVKGSTK